MAEFSKNIEVVEFNDIPIPLPSVKRRLGYPSGQTEIKGAIKGIFESMLAAADEQIVPRGVFRICTPQNRTGSVLTLVETDFYLESKKLCGLLRNSDYIVIFYATIGPGISHAARQCSSDGLLTESLILDAIGSETADEVADHIHRHHIAKQADKKGYKVTARFSPGYGDWPLTVQPYMAEACEAGRIGITVDGSSFMSPVKSVSAVFGLEKISVK